MSGVLERVLRQEGYGARDHVRRLRADARYVVTDFQPAPHGEVRGKGVYLTTTAPPEAASKQARLLEEIHGCRVVGFSSRLADRRGLIEDLDATGEYDILVTELKAAAVDVAGDRARGRGAEVVFFDNRPVTTGGDGELTDLLRDGDRVVGALVEDLSTGETKRIETQFVLNAAGAWAGAAARRGNEVAGSTG